VQKKGGGGIAARVMYASTTHARTHTHAHLPLRGSTACVNSCKMARTYTNTPTPAFHWTCMTHAGQGGSLPHSVSPSTMGQGLWASGWIPMWDTGLTPNQRGDVSTPPPHTHTHIHKYAHPTTTYTIQIIEKLTRTSELHAPALAVKQSV
jgi:hypothetical protein